MPFSRCPALRMSACILPIVVAIVIAAWPTLSTAADKYEQAVTGKWKLTTALDGAEITSLDEREAQRLVGRVFTIQKDKVQFGSRVCGPSEFEAERVEPRRFLREQFHASSEKLALPNPVTVVDLSCTSVFIRNRNRLVIAWDGWFFDAVRTK